MKLNAPRTALVAMAFASLFAGASCTSNSDPANKAKPAADEKPVSAKATTDVKPAAKGESAGNGTRAVAIRAGEAGGVVQDTFTASATVRGIDAATREITLVSSDGGGDGGAPATIKAGPEVRNFDQIHVGDTVTATVVETLYVFVRDGKDPKSVTHVAALAAAPKGAKPGALIAEAFEVTATVKSIDSENRKATIEFADGSTKTVTPRPDVELSRYKAGDTLVIQISQVVSVLVAKP